jgi:hypothetical protein
MYQHEVLFEAEGLSQSFNVYSLKSVADHPASTGLSA